MHGASMHEDLLLLLGISAFYWRIVFKWGACYTLVLPPMCAQYILWVLSTSAWEFRGIRGSSSAGHFESFYALQPPREEHIQTIPSLQSLGALQSVACMTCHVWQTVSPPKGLRTGVRGDRDFSAHGDLLLLQWDPLQWDPEDVLLPSVNTHPTCLDVRIFHHSSSLLN
jgi:hypothetical protein